MVKGLFITATGTDVGKTYITALLTKLLRSKGINAGYYKAALSGAKIENGKVVECDCLDVLKEAKINGEAKDFVSYIMETPVSPHLARKIEGIDITLEKIKNDFNKIKNEYDFITIEGSGGIICPLNIEDNLMLTDVIKELGLDILIVSNAFLGSINSTVLTVEYARNNGINVKGIILNKFEKENYMHRDNKNIIEQLTGIPVIDEIEISGDINIGLEEICSLYKEI